MRETWQGLIDRIAARLVAQPSFATDLAGLRDLEPRVKPRGSDTLPIQAHWPAAGKDDPLGELLATLDHDLAYPWQQNPNYRAKPPSDTFLANYGYLECAGPDAPYHSPSLRLGLLLLGPNTLYPRHAHPAEEVYLPLGPGRWWKEGGDWQFRAAGTVIHHPPMCGHATQSGDLPLAAIYLWRGEIARAAEIS